MQGKAWRVKKREREHPHRHRRMSAKERRAFKERMEASKRRRRRERWNAYGSHENINTTISPATLVKRRRGF
jgi:hypothetical protein